MRSGSKTHARLLLDSHALIWGLDDEKKLSFAARRAIDAASEVYVSAASLWEVMTKYRIGKLSVSKSIVDDFEKTLHNLDLKSLPVSMAHAHKAGLLPGTHRDPFDRMLIAQALIENFTLISNEKIFDQYGVKRIW